jgi:uncharacterized C2H2 Zn-finger protein
MTAPASSSRRKRRSRHTDDLTPERVTSSFLACPRCSFFLSGYKLINVDFIQAVEKSDNGWLDLTWNHDTRHLVQKSYGYMINKDTIQYEGICRDCQRVFTYGQPESAEESTRFRIEIVPG